MARPGFDVEFAIVELRSPLFRELEEQFIDDAGRLQQKIGGRLAAEKRSGDLPQTRVDKGERRVEGASIANHSSAAATR